MRDDLAKLEKTLTDAGVSPETSPKYQDLRARLAQTGDLTTLENEVYSDLYTFFRRYYKDGDFLSLRRYKPGVYAIPADKITKRPSIPLRLLTNDAVVEQVLTTLDWVIQEIRES